MPVPGTWSRSWRGRTANPAASSLRSTASTPDARTLRAKVTRRPVYPPSAGVRARPGPGAGPAGRRGCSCHDPALVRRRRKPYTAWWWGGSSSGPPRRTRMHRGLRGSSPPVELLYAVRPRTRSPARPSPWPAPARPPRRRRRRRSRRCPAPRTGSGPSGGRGGRRPAGRGSRRAGAPGTGRRGAARSVQRASRPRPSQRPGGPRRPAARPRAAGTRRGSGAPRAGPPPPGRCAGACPTGRRRRGGTGPYGLVRPSS